LIIAENIYIVATRNCLFEGGTALH